MAVSYPVVYVFALSRALVSIALAGMFLITGRDWILAWTGVSIPAAAFGVGGFLLFAGVSVWSWNKLFATLKAHAPRVQPVHCEIVGDNYVGRVYRFRRGVILATVIFDILLWCYPYITKGHREIVPATYIFYFGVATIVLLVLTYLVRYRVWTERDRIVIRAFRTSEIAYSGIDSVRVITAGGRYGSGPCTVVVLSNGDRIQFSGMLADYHDLIATLRLKTASSAQWA